MGSRAPGVRKAMLSVGRRLKLRLPSTGRVAVVRKHHRESQASSHFITSSVEELCKRTESMAPTPGGKDGPNHGDLPMVLRAFLGEGRSSHPPTRASLHATSPTRTTGEKTNKAKGGGANAKDVLAEYRPPIDPNVLSRVASAVDMEEALQRASKLTRALRDGGELSSMLSAGPSASPFTMQEVELQAGIAARLHQGKGRGSRQRLKLQGFRLLTSDLQVAEVLPSGDIVTFTDATLPNVTDMCDRELAGEDKPLPYLYFVLYKENVPLGEAFKLLSEASGGACRPEDFAASVALEESAVTVQLCSVHIPFTSSASGETRQSHVARLLKVNLRPLRLNVQIIGWRDTPCETAAGWKSQAQYSMLVRGIHASNPRHLEGKVLAKFAAFPNFFGPRYFGSSCLFRTYHAAAAWERGMHAEALVVAACLSCAETVAVGRQWVDKLVELLHGGEDRPSVLKEWHMFNVPRRLKAQIASSKAALVWNTLASCRIQRLAECSVEGSPDVGDFVVRGVRLWGESEGTAAKAELFPEYCCEHPYDSASAERKSNPFKSAEAVKLVTAEEDAAPYTLHDIVIPLDIQTNSVARDVATTLGFHPDSRPMTDISGQVRFRSLLVAGSGYPHAGCPWVKVLPEPSASIIGSEKNAFKLLADAELRRSNSYTTLSRGSPRVVWPIGKFGHRLTDRLPAGIVSVAASDNARKGTRCLAMHFTLPAQAYSMSALREFITIEDCTEASGHTVTGGNNHGLKGAPPQSEEVVREVETKGQDDLAEEIVDGDLMSLGRRIPKKEKEMAVTPVCDKR